MAVNRERPGRDVDGPGGDDEEEVGAGEWFGLRQHVDRLVRGRVMAPPPAGASPRSVRKAIDQLDDRERRYSLIAVVAAVIFSVLIYAVETHSRTFHTTKGQLQPQTTLYLGLVAAVLLVGATYIGRRAFVAFVCLFAFFIFSNGSNSIVAGLPFIGLGGWLLYRSFQTQRRAASADRERSASKATAPSKAAPSRSAPVRPKPARRGKDTGRPAANKRYTPKRPPPPAPKPSRRERKAAEAKE